MTSSNKNQVRRAAIYIRIGSPEQADQRISEQEDSVKRYCEEKGYTVSESHIYMDNGFSGTLSVSNRPALNNLVNDAKNEKFDTVVVYEISRLFRSVPKLLDTVEKLKKLKIDVESVTETFNTSTPEGNLLLNTIASIAQYEKGIRKARQTV